MTVSIIIFFYSPKIFIPFLPRDMVFLPSESVIKFQRQLVSHITESSLAKYVTLVVKDEAELSIYEVMLKGQFTPGINKN